MGEIAAMKKTDFKQLFTEPNWYPQLKELIKTPESRAQFVSFLRSEPFMAAMKKAVGTDIGRLNIVMALKDEKVRGIMLANFDSHTVRWAIGDLYNSPDGQKVMKMLLAPVTLAGLGAVKDIVKAMTGTRLPMSEIIRDFNRYKKKEEEYHVRPERMEWFRNAMGSDQKAKEFLRELGTDEGKGKIIALLRTQEIRPEMDRIMAAPQGRRRLADMLKSGAGLDALGTAMMSAEGVNAVGYLWNMPNGKALLKENMIGPSGIKALYKIMAYQMMYNKIEETLKQVPRMAK